MLANHRDKSKFTEEKNPGYILLDVIFTHVTLTPSDSFSNIVERNCVLYLVPHLGIAARVDFYSI
jgi:hypothetical protein